MTNWAEIVLLPENSTAYSDTKRACGTAYSYRVRAYRASDEQYSQYTNVAIVATDFCKFKIYLPLLIQ